MKPTKPKGKTAADLMAELNDDPNFLARQRDKEEAIHKKAVEWRKSEIPLLEELRKIGLHLTSVWDLVNSPTPYPPQAVSVLLDHLNRPYPERVREGIARALAVPEAIVGWNLLLDVFRSESDETTFGVKWAVGCALAVAGNDDVIDDLFALLKERQHGPNRAALLPALARSSDPRARVALGELRDDPQLANEVRKILRGAVPKE